MALCLVVDGGDALSCRQCGTDNLQSMFQITRCCRAQSALQLTHFSGHLQGRIDYGYLRKTLLQNIFVQFFLRGHLCIELPGC